MKSIIIIRTTDAIYTFTSHDEWYQYVIYYSGKWSQYNSCTVLLIRSQFTIIILIYKMSSYLQFPIVFYNTNISSTILIVQTLQTGINFPVSYVSRKIYSVYVTPTSWASLNTHSICPYFFYSYLLLYFYNGWLFLPLNIVKHSEVIFYALWRRKKLYIQQVIIIFVGNRFTSMRFFSPLLLNT